MIDLDKLLSDVETRREYKARFSKEHYDRITVNLPKGAKERLQEQALREGISVSEFARNCLLRTTCLHRQKP